MCTSSLPLTPFAMNARMVIDRIPKKAKIYDSLQDMLLKLKETESWRGKIPTQEGFSKEDKEALNLIIFAVIKEFMLSDEDDLSGLPAYIIWRLYTKAYTWDSKPENKLYLRELIPSFDEQVNQYINSKLAKSGLEPLAEFLYEEAQKVSEKVSRVYKAARVIGTLIEYEEVKERLRPDIAEETRLQVRKDIYNFSDLPGFIEIVEGIGEYGKLKSLFRAISCSRYTVRWQGYIRSVKCSILAHMLESAVIGYVMNLEDGVSYTEEEMLKDFWVLLFHDLAEIWTDDIPSPVKDSIIMKNPDPELVKKVRREEISLRDITELQEVDALDKHFYAKLPLKVVKFFKNGIMLEEVEDTEKKKFYKAADYFAADLEVWWNIKGGSREMRFKEILNDSFANGNRTPASRELLKEFCGFCEQIVFL